MLRSLTHYWRIHLAVILGAAVATSVLTGALLVGDSVQGSLRALTLGRLGKVDHAVVGAGYFREALAEAVEANTSGIAAPMIAVKATIEAAGSGARANGVDLFGVGERFGRLFDGTPVDASGGTRLRTLHANDALRKTLGVADGEALILTIEARSDIHREFLFGREDSEARLIRRRVRLGSPVSDAAGARFSFEPNQSLPLVAFVDLRALQAVLGAEGRVNRVLVQTDIGDSQLTQQLATAADLEDYGLALRGHGDVVSLESDRFLLSTLTADAARATADERGLAATGVFTYLANTIASGDRGVPYATVAAVGAWSDLAPPPQLRTADGRWRDLPSGGEILVNDVTSGRLGASRGDAVTLSYFEVESDESFVESDATFAASGVVRMEGLAGDPALTPDFPGLHDADNMADWDAPFPVDFSRITDADERYWDAHKATPKAFISLDRGRALWDSRFGALTAVRYHVPADGDVEATRSGIAASLKSRLSPESQGIRLLPLREQGLQSARGATDFSGLFIGFSMFLVVSALTMMAQLFKLGIEDRRSEIGLLKAVGYTDGKVRVRLVGEGLVLAAVGSLIGTAGAVWYARAMIHGLSTWWVDAVGTRLLAYDGRVETLAVGAVAGILTVTTIVWRSVGRATRERAVRLMKHREAEGVHGGTPVKVFRVAAGLAAAGLVGGWLAPEGMRVGLFFGVAVCALTALLAGVRVLSSRGRGDGTFDLAMAQLARFPGRTTAGTTLIATAVFVLVTVGLNRHDVVDDAGLPAGAGGFRWLGETTVPMSGDMNDAATLVDLGVPREAIEQAGPVDVHAFRLKPGEDVSCLNLHRPGQPRILGVGPRTIERGGFPIYGTVDGVEPERAWHALEMTLEEGVIPAIGDFNSVQWILHSGLGKEIVVQDERGEPLRLRFVALLDASVLQSEILISEAHFVKHFPSIEGRSFFAIEGEAAGGFGPLLDQHLDAYGMDVTTTAFRLARYRAVENTYMSTFQMIGGLGVLLGTLGVGVLMMRSAAERRGELAALRAIGFSHARLQGLLTLETVLLIAGGVVAGFVAGVLATAPTLVDRGFAAPWSDVFVTMAAVVVAGLLSGRLTAWVALRAPIVETLKADR